MYYSVSKLVALILAFCLGFASCGGVLLGSGAVVLSAFKVRDIERAGIELPDEYFMGDSPQVDLLDLTALDFLKEIKTVQSKGDEVTLNYLQERYDLKIHRDIDKILTDKARKMPIKQLLSSEGIVEMFSNVYIGHIEKYECHSIETDEIAEPSLGKELTRWYDPVSEKYITGIGATIAYFSLGDFLGGGINVDSVLHGIVLADVLGYTSQEDEFGNKVWYDSNGEKVTGLMAVFADCTIDSVDEKVNTVKIGEFLGYEQHEEGIWYESGSTVPVSGFMNKIANSSISGEKDSIGSVFNTLEIGDIVDEEERQKGIFSIIPANTRIDQIDSVVNTSITGSALQFFMNQGMITFEDKQQKSLDDLCILKGEVKEYSADDPDFIKYYEGHGTWEVDSSGNYLVPKWRTQPLDSSFSYIVGLLVPTTIEEP